MKEYIVQAIAQETINSFDAQKGVVNMTRRNTFIPFDIQCFWCNGQMERGTVITGELNCVTYFCKRCGGVSHFAVNEKQKINSIEVEYKSPDKGT